MSIFNTHVNRYLLSNGIPLTMSISGKDLNDIYSKILYMIEPFVFDGTIEEAYKSLSNTIKFEHADAQYLKALLVALVLLGEKVLVKRIMIDRGSDTVRFARLDGNFNIIEEAVRFKDLWTGFMKNFFNPLLEEYHDMIDNILNTYDFE